MKRLITRVFLFIAIAISYHVDAVLASGKPVLKTLDNYTRLVFPVSKKSTFQVVKDPSSSRNFLVGLKAHDSSSWKFPSTLEDHRVRAEIRAASDENRSKVLLNLKSNNVEHFAYFQPTPPAVIIDIWRKKNADRVARRARIKNAKLKKARKLSSIIKKKNKEIESVGQLSFKNHFFQRIPFFMSKYSSGTDAKTRSPNSGWEWTVPKDGKGGGTGFSLAVKMLRDKKFGLAIKASRITQKEFPNGKYYHEIKYLEAIALRELSMLDNDKDLMIEYVRLLKELMFSRQKNGKALEFSYKIREYFALDAYEKGQWLETIDKLEVVTSSQDQIDKNDMARVMLILAEAYLRIGQFRRAERLYLNIKKSYSGTKFAKEAIYRIPYLLAKNGLFTRSIEAAKDALRTAPDYEKVRFELYYNLAEAYFRQENYSKSSEAYFKFIELHPSNTSASYAWVRVGEIAEITKNDQKLAQSRYLQVINRFPFTLAHSIASVRLARLKLYSQDDKSYRIAILDKILKDNTVKKNIRWMAKNVLAGYYLKNADHENAIKIAKSGMVETSGEAYERFKNKFIDGKLLKLKFLANGEDTGAVVNFYSKNRTWLDKRAETLNYLAKVYTQFGLRETGHQLNKSYLAQLAKGGAGRGIASAKDIKDKNVYLAAKISFLKGRYKQSLAMLELMKDRKSNQLRVKAFGKLGMNKKAYELAKNELNKTKKIAKYPEQSALELIDFTDAVIKWHSDRREYALIEQTLKKANSKLSNSYGRYLYKYADFLWLQSKFIESVTAYSDALKNMPSDPRASKARYRKGVAYVNLGNRREAVKILTEVAEDGQNLWAQSAQQELKLLDWERKYSLILKDLPPAGLGISD